MNSPAAAWRPIWPAMRDAARGRPRLAALLALVVRVQEPGEAGGSGATGGATLTLSVPEDRLEYVRGHAGDLQTLAGDAAGRPVGVRVVPAEAGAAPAGPSGGAPGGMPVGHAAANAGDGAGERAEDAEHGDAAPAGAGPTEGGRPEEHPLVLEAMRVFQARVKHVSPRRPEA